MRFEVVAHEDSYGKHRYPNNAILNELMRHSESSPELLFVWWVEKMFLVPRYDAIVRRMCSTDWFGVMHVPLLTPNWAMYGQNDIGKLYFLDTWRAALRNCRGIVVLSQHMEQQLKALYPDLNVFSVKHPMAACNVAFDFEAFCRDPKLLLVGTWLRNFDRFFDLETDWTKKLIINHYSEEFLQQRYSKYRPGIAADVKTIDHTDFLDDDDYDAMLRSSVVFLSMHETSANNALCECISYSVPFIAKRHPAIEEYCGEDYPLLRDSDEDLRLSLEEVYNAHQYLDRADHLRAALSIKTFIQHIEEIWREIT